MRTVLLILATAAFVLVAYWPLSVVWTASVQGVAVLVVLICNFSYLKEISSLEREKQSLSADAWENRRNRERAEKILGGSRN